MKMASFHDLIMFFNSDLFDWHWNKKICLKNKSTFCFVDIFFLRRKMQKYFGCFNLNFPFIFSE